MRNMIILNYFIGLLMLVIVTNAEPKNVASIVGKSATLPCDLPHSDPPQIKWVDWIHNQGREPQGIFSSDNNPNRDIDSSHPNGARMEVGEDFSLTINDLAFGDSGDSGEYICKSIDADGIEVELVYQLNIAGLLECSGNGDLVEGDASVLNCAAPFSGSDVPTLGWYIGEDQMESDDKNEIGKARQHFNIESASEIYDGKTLTCKMEFQDNKEECSIPVTVKYLVNKIEIVPTTEEIRVNDEVKCTANGNPKSKLSLVFTGSDVSETIEGEEFVSFVVPTSWEGKELSAACRGSNTLDKEVHQMDYTQKYKVLAPPTTTISTSTTLPPTMAVKVMTDSMGKDTEPPKPDPTKKIAPETPKPGAGSDGEKPGTKTGGGNTVGIVAGVIIAALVIVVIVIAVACILRKTSKKHKGAKPVPTKEEDLKRMEDGKGVWRSSLAYSEGEKHGRYRQTHPFPPLPSNGAIPGDDGVFYHKDGSGETGENVDVGLVGSVDLDTNRESTAFDTSNLNFTDVDYSQILHPQNRHSANGSSSS